MHQYQVGDTVVYYPFGGDRRTVLVEAKYADIKNGRPGFDGRIVGASGDDVFTVWGYDDQITSIIPASQTGRAG